MIELLAVLTGFLGLAVVHHTALPIDPQRADYLPDRVSAMGWALLAVVFLSAALVALRNARRAGWIVLIGSPVIALCLSFKQAYGLVEHPDGLYFEPLGWKAAAAQMLCPFAAWCAWCGLFGAFWFAQEKWGLLPHSKAATRGR